MNDDGANGCAKVAQTQGSAEPVALVHTEAGERFIPVPKSAIMQLLGRAEVWQGGDLASVRTFFQFLAHWRHLTYADRENALIEAYQPFNPDRDTVLTNPVGPDDAGQRKAEFIEMVRALLERANYDEIPQDKLADVVAEENPYGLHMEANLDEFEDLYVFVRGQSDLKAEPGRITGKLLGKKALKFIEYQRLFVLFKLKPIEARALEVMRAERISQKQALGKVKRTRRHLPKGTSHDQIYLKLFKNIPRTDIEMLFPTTHVRLKHHDKAILGATAGGGIGMGVVGTATKLIAAAMSPIGAGMAVASLFGAAGQQYARLNHARTRYQIQIANSLYFQNLANNQGVLALLTERGEEEDIKEELLLYTLLARERVNRAQLADAKTAIEMFLFKAFEVNVVFDVEDALERLLGDGIVTQAADGSLKTMDPATAATHIEAKWTRHLAAIRTRERS